MNSNFDYNGPYPRYTLSKARQILIQGMQACDSYTIEKVKPKLGISSRFGKKIPLPPLPGQSDDEPGPGFEESCEAFMNGRRPSITVPPDPFITNSIQQHFAADSNTYSDQFTVGYGNTSDYSNVSHSVPIMGYNSPKDMSVERGNCSGTGVGNNSINSINLGYSSASPLTSPDYKSNHSFDKSPINDYSNDSYTLNRLFNNSSSSSISSPVPKERSISPVDEECNTPIFYSGMMKKSREQIPKPAALSVPPSSSRSKFSHDYSKEATSDRKMKRSHSEGNLDSQQNDDVLANKRQRVDLNNMKVNNEMRSRHSDSFLVKLNETIMTEGSDEIGDVPDWSPSKVSVYRGTFTGSNQLLFDIYKCDFCESVYGNLQKLKQHLVSKQHFSGSLYNATNSQGGIELVSIKKMLVAKNEFCKNNRFAVVCPDCKDVFEDIFMCAIHSKYVHNRISGFYTVCPVVNHETVIMSREPICSKCDQHFESHFILHRHWSKDEHHPLDQSRKPDNSLTIITCPYCSKGFRSNFVGGKMHVLNHKEVSHKDSVVLQVKEVIVVSKHQELPQVDNHDRNGIQIEIELLKDLVKHLDQEAYSNMKTKNVNNRINFLKSTLSL